MKNLVIVALPQEHYDYLLETLENTLEVIRPTGTEASKHLGQAVKAFADGVITEEVRIVLSALQVINRESEDAGLELMKVLDGAVPGCLDPIPDPGPARSSQVQ